MLRYGFNKKKCTVTEVELQRSLLIKHLELSDISRTISFNITVITTVECAELGQILFGVRCIS
jgi:hypothetical protein